MRRKKTEKFQVASIGGATRDFMFYSQEGELINSSVATKKKLLAFEYGAKIVADRLHFSFGGGAANTAASFSKLGLKTAIVCRIGQDSHGHQILANLKERKISTQFVKFDSRRRTGFSMILTVDNPEKEHVIFSYRGANDGLRPADFPNGLAADWFYLSSLPNIGWEKIVAKAANRGKLAFNPGSRQLSQLTKLEKIMPKVSLLLVNRDEANEFRKIKNIRGLLKYIQRLGPKIAVITDGAAGAYVYDGRKYYFMKSRSTKLADTVGAGDAFGAAFAAAIITGLGIRQALSWGIKNSAAVLSRIGAQNGILTKSKIKR